MRRPVAALILYLSPNSSWLRQPARSAGGLLIGEAARGRADLPPSFTNKASR